jgi:hypothetical protein
VRARLAPAQLMRLLLYFPRADGFDVLDLDCVKQGHLKTAGRVSSHERTPLSATRDSSNGSSPEMFPRMLHQEQKHSFLLCLKFCVLLPVLGSYDVSPVVSQMVPLK